MIVSIMDLFIYLLSVLIMYYGVKYQGFNSE